jgi:hypothetical protein
MKKALNCAALDFCTFFEFRFQREASSSVINFDRWAFFALPRNLFSWRKPLSEDELKKCAKSSGYWVAELSIVVNYY